LFGLKAAVWVVAITALDHSFQHLVMERLVKVGLNFVVTTDAELRFTNLQQMDRREVRLLRVGSVDERNRLRNVSVRFKLVRRVTAGAANIVAPVFTAPEVVSFLSTGVAGQTGFRYFFGRLVLERNDLGWVALFEMGFAWTMTRFAPGNFSFPATNRRQL